VKILILDDERLRHDAFDRAYKNHEVHHAYTPEQFRKAVERHQFDVISFDHDLGGPETGLHCARWMLTTEHWPAQAVVHSWNPSGGRAIFDLLHQAGIPVLHKPFAQGGCP
jgi:DNA-binding NarL/FixJ family response regulator